MKTKIIKNQYLPFLLLTVALVITHMFMSLNYNDDADYALILDRMGVIPFLIDRYKAWSSRTLIELVMVYVVRIPWLWKLMDIGMYLIIAFCLSYLIPSERLFFKNTVIAFSLLLYPYGDMAVAGWVACSTGYFWTVALGIYALTTIKRVNTGSKIRWFEYVLLIGATAYAGNHEQSSLCLILLFSCGIVFFYCVKKRVSKMLMVQLSISIANLIYILLSPGNAVRGERAVRDLMPNYHELSIIEKLYMAYQYTVNHFIMSFNIVFVVLGILLCILVYKKTNKTWIRLASGIPLLYSFCAVIQPWNRLVFLFEPLAELDVLFDSRRKMFPVVMTFIIIGCILLGLYHIYQDTFHFMLNAIVLAAGFGSRLAMGFSATVYASHNRTASFFYFSLIFVIIYLAAYCEDCLDRKLISLLLGGTAGICCLNLVLDIIANQGILPKY